MKKQILLTFVILFSILLAGSYGALSLFMQTEVEESASATDRLSKDVILGDLKTREMLTISTLLSLSNFIPKHEQDWAAWLDVKIEEHVLFEDLFIVDASGQGWDKSGHSKGFNAKDSGRQYYQDVVVNNKDFSLGSPIIDTRGKLVVLVAVPIYRDGQRLGLLAGTIDYSVLIQKKGLDVAFTTADGTVFFGDGVASSWDGESVFELNPAYKNITETSPPFLYSTPKGDWFTASKVNVRNGFLAWVITQQNEQIKTMDAIKNSIAMGGAVIALLIVILLWLDLNRRLSPISQFVEWISALSNGDLKSRKINKSNNELDLISDSLSVLTDQLNTTVLSINSSMDGINQKQDESIRLIEGNRSNSINELSAVELIATASTELSSTARDVADNAQRADQAAMEANEIIQQGQSSLKNSTDTTENVSQSISETQVIVNALREHSEHISSVVDVINNISDQTNLLALNAAIEAARAGEYGRGFAVVADEVRALAGKTQQSTIDIQEIIAQLQEQSKQAHDSMGRNVELMALTQSTTEALAQSFHAISEKVASISDVNSIVATASEEQSVVTNDISTQLENMSVLVQKNLDGVESSIKFNESVVEVTKALNNELSFFKVDKG
jgi:methyl-accepting chemotaxis protein